MTEHAYVKLEYPEVISAKRDILSCEASFLNLLRKVDNYKNLRKNEFALKLKLSATIRKIKKEINSALSIMPKVSKEVLHKIKVKHIHVGKEIERETKKQRDIEEQLIEIKEKLERLQ